MSKLERVKAESLRAQVYVQLKTKLLEGVWKVGQKLPSENELCQSFGVSRVTVRAAIQQLEILGLVETKHGGGTFVKDFSTINAMDAFHPLMQVRRNQDIITVLEYRKIIEKGAIALAVPKLTEKDIEDLEASYDVLCECNKDPAKQAQADLDFHYKIALIAQNPIITKVYGIINEILSAAMVDIVILLGCEIGLRYHRKIIDAMKRGDVAASESLMEAHIEETIQSVLKAGRSESRPGA